MTEEMMTEDNEHAIVTIDELREIAEKNTRWRRAVEYVLNDDDVILSSMAPLGTAKTTWRQVRSMAEDFSDVLSDAEEWALFEE